MNVTPLNTSELKRLRKYWTFFVGNALFQELNNLTECIWFKSIVQSKKKPIWIEMEVFQVLGKI